MRTAKYTIRIEAGMHSYQAWNRSKKADYKPWSRFIATCEALAKDGFDYAVSIVRTGDPFNAPFTSHITITITGTAGRAVAAKKPARRSHVAMPAKVTPEKCAKQ